ncbi:zinc finger protein 271-like [Anopheles marshallii]|uniref:zinc finger protein 271-like n=1 Tax=Anopheles marshallii TaxID=1521116 RepID=UPI00237B9D75|nr:zinc finger protein 271-like [Anopheles marshallii]
MEEPREVKSGPTKHSSDTGQTEGESIQRPTVGRMVVICRICLSTRPRMISIHSPVPEYDQKTLYAMLLSVCLPLNQRETVQGFPEQICRNCQWKLLTAYDLYETTLASDEQLRAQQQSGTVAKVPKIPPTSEVIKPESVVPMAPNVGNDGVIRVKEETPDDGYEEQYGTGSRTEDDSSMTFDPCGEIKTISVHPDVSMLIQRTEQGEGEEEDPGLLEETKPPIPDPLESFIAEHYQVDEASGNHVCGLCKQEFPYKSQCRMHIVQKHNPAKPFKCDICFCTLTSHLRLVRHKIVAHGAGQIKREDVIEAHNDSTGEMTYTCPICRKVFNSSVRFKRHKNVHVVHNRPFKCEVCLYRFATKPQLTQHAKVHETKQQSGLSPGSSEVGEFPCDRCEEIFTGKRALTMHLKKAHQVYRVAGGARPDERERSEYVCIICKATFARETVLNTHMKMHELLAAEKEKERRLDLERMVKQELQQQIQLNMPPLPPLSPEVVDRSACVLEPFALGLVPVAKPGTGTGTNNNNNTSINNNSPPTVGGSGGPSGLMQGGKRKVPIPPPTSSDMAYVCPVCDMEFDERDVLKKHQKEQHARLQVGIVSSKLGEPTSPNTGCNPQAKMMPRFSDMPGLKMRLMDSSVRPSKKRLLADTTALNYIDDGEPLDHDESLDNDGHITAGLLPIDDIPSSTDRRSASGATATTPGEEPSQFQCELCHKKFPYNCYLTMHMRKNHDKSKPFGCKVCHYRFGYRGTLLRHQLIHSSQRVQPGSHGSIIFKCRICSAKFLELKQLNVHLKTHRKVADVHDTNRQVQLIQCDECPQIFSEPAQLTKHMLKEHQKHDSSDDDLYDTVQHAGVLVNPASSSLRADSSYTGASTLNDLKLNPEQSKDDGTTIEEEYLDDDISMIKIEPVYD